MESEKSENGIIYLVSNDMRRSGLGHEAWQGHGLVQRGFGLGLLVLHGQVHVDPQRSLSYRVAN